MRTAPCGSIVWSPSRDPREPVVIVLRGEAFQEVVNRHHGHPFLLTLGVPVGDDGIPGNIPEVDKNYRVVPHHSAWLTPTMTASRNTRPTTIHPNERDESLSASQPTCPVWGTAGSAPVCSPV